MPYKKNSQRLSMLRLCFSPGQPLPVSTAAGPLESNASSGATTPPTVDANANANAIPPAFADCSDSGRASSGAADQNQNPKARGAEAKTQAQPDPLKEGQHLLEHPEEWLYFITKSGEPGERGFREPRACPCNSVYCCGTCRRVCEFRCPQDVIQRALFACFPYLDSDGRNYSQEVPLWIRLLLSEFKKAWPETKKEGDVPSYYVLKSMVEDSFRNKEVVDYWKANRISPISLDYAPQVLRDARGRKLRDPITNELLIMEWPLSGMCPYCFPYLGT